MTFGEKLKKARKQFDEGQIDYASRSAVAKWESDKGMPDLSNLRVMAQLFNVSIDYLLDETQKINLDEIKEPINLDDYKGEGKRRDKKNAVCLAKNPDADRIFQLARTRKLNKLEWVVDFLVQPGIIDIVDYLGGISAFYLVEKKKGNF